MAIWFIIYFNYGLRGVYGSQAGGAFANTDVGVPVVTPTSHRQYKLNIFMGTMISTRTKS